MPRESKFMLSSKVLLAGLKTVAQLALDASLTHTLG